MQTTHDAPGNTANAASSESGVCDFETAITACGFGRFNVCLLMVSMSGLLSTIFSSSSLSYILPTAECDLQLTLMYKGILNAICFAGMIVSAIPWGYIADTMGRKKVLVYGLLVDGVFVVCSGISQDVQQLLAFKFVDGFFVSGPFAVVMSYVSEFHALKHRSRIMMVIGMIKAAAAIILPLIARALLPYHLAIETDHFKLHTWQFFILIISVVPLAGGFLHMIFPESPKFLMSQGRNDEALKCLQQVYAINHRKSKKAYPVTQLIDEAPEKTLRNSIRNSDEFKASIKTMSDKRRLAKQQFREGLQQLRPMCMHPYLALSVQVYCMLFSILLGLNTIRLWMPQIFATIVEFENNNMGVSSSMCNILSYSSNKTRLFRAVQLDKNCDVHITPRSYNNNIIVAVASFCGFLVASFCINKIGNNNVLRISLGFAFVSGIALYFSTSSLMTLIISSIFITAANISATTVLSVSINLFPTTMRTMVIIMVMTFGRLGSLLGNILFPYLISMGCIPPFVLIGGVMIVAFLLSLFLPNSNKDALK